MKYLVLTSFTTLACVLAPVSGQQAIDGLADESYGPPLAIQDTRTGFGNSDLGFQDFCNGSELDQAFGMIMDGNLYLHFAGNLENNFNHLEVFIDSIPGEGQNSILNNNPDTDFGALGNMGNYGAKGDKDYAQGLTFDSDFAADFWLDAACGNDPFELYVNYSVLETGGNPDSNTGFGGPGFSGEAGAVSIIIDEKTGLDIRAAIDNSNIDGVLACEELDCLNGDGSNVLSGFEVKIPLEVLGYSEGDSLKVVAFINNSDHFFVSNQVLPGIGGLTNLEYSRAVDFSQIDGQQYFEVMGGTGPDSCQGDFNTDGEVDGADFGGMLAAWGPCSAPCVYDLSEDGLVSGADVGLLLSLWGPCETP
jgi:hypothetical protein